MKKILYSTAFILSINASFAERGAKQLHMTCTNDDGHHYHAIADFGSDAIVFAGTTPSSTQFGHMKQVSPNKFSGAAMEASIPGLGRPGSFEFDGVDWETRLRRSNPVEAKVTVNEEGKKAKVTSYTCKKHENV